MPIYASDFPGPHSLEPITDAHLLRNVVIGEPGSGPSTSYAGGQDGYFVNIDRSPPAPRAYRTLRPVPSGWFKQPAAPPPTA